MITKAPPPQAWAATPLPCIFSASLPTSLSLQLQLQVDPARPLCTLYCGLELLHLPAKVHSSQPACPAGLWDSTLSIRLAVVL